MTKNKKESLLKQAYVTNTQGYLDVSAKRELWKNIAKETGGRFKISHDSGNVIEILRIHLTHNGYEITISESDTRPLKFEIEFETYTNYKLAISLEDSFDKILRKLRRKDLKIGNHKFDDHYCIKSNDRYITQKVLTTEIVNILLEYNVYSLSYATNKKRGIASFISTIDRTTEEKEKFITLIELHKKIIDQLTELRIIKKRG